MKGGRGFAGARHASPASGRRRPPGDAPRGGARLALLLLLLAAPPARAEPGAWLHDAWTGTILDEGDVVVWTFSADRRPEGDVVRSAYRFTFMRNGKERKTWTRTFVRLARDPEPILCVDELVVKAEPETGSVRVHYNDPELDLIAETKTLLRELGPGAASVPGAPEGAAARYALWKADALLFGSELAGQVFHERVRAEGGPASGPRRFDRLLLFDEVGGVFLLQAGPEDRPALRRSWLFFNGAWAPDDGVALAAGKESAGAGRPPLPGRFEAAGKTEKSTVTGALEALGDPQPGADFQTPPAWIQAVKGELRLGGVRRSVFGAAESRRAAP